MRCSRRPRLATKAAICSASVWRDRRQCRHRRRVFQSFGAALVDEKGNITVKSDKVRQALEYYMKLTQWLPPDAPAWDNASNNNI